MSEKSRIQQLYRLWMDKAASSEELNELWERLGGENTDEIYKLLQDQWQREDGKFELADDRCREILNDILRRNQPARIAHFRLWWRIAAACVVLAVGTWWIWEVRRQSAEAPVADVPTTTSPGGAILTLADGTLVSLDTLRNGVVALQGGARARVVNGVLTYEGAADQIVYNTISTPKGRQYQVQLSEGTKVWLNAGSSIRYPLRFTDTARNVTVTGETYFAVAQNVHAPFRVDVRGKTVVEVLGTDFNINAYENELQIRTTLVSGKVRITSPTMGEHLTLQPGQQAVTSGSGQLQVATADIERVTAWKSGVFHFNGASFEEMMREVERWYDVDVVYQGPIPALEFQGELPRYIKLSDLMATLQKFGVQHKLDGRRVIILSN
jgi:ferric-dicitrate binding protein FerR (iron transport regulator)